MEVTIVDTGGLPESTIVSFHAGPTRQHAQMEKGKVMSLHADEPVRVDVMAEVGRHTFNMVPGQDIYDVPLGRGRADDGEVSLKFQIREEMASGAREGSGDFAPQSSVSPSRKLQTALMMRNYLNTHDVIRKLQDLLEDMVVHRPEDPVEYMIQRLEASCQQEQEVILEGATSAVPALPSGQAAGVAPKQGMDVAAPTVPAPRPEPELEGVEDCRRKVIPKDDTQKARLKEVLQSCWMFQSHSPESVDVIMDAMEERVVSPDVQLIKQGEDGDVMWVIEEGVLECFKFVDGQSKSVKVCKHGDAFGELALIYNSPRAATVVSKERCLLWELDRETFKSTCCEAARQYVYDYEGFHPPDFAVGGSSGSRGARRREGVSAEACSKLDSANWVPPFHRKTPEERRQLSDIIRTSPDSKLHMLFGTVTKDTFEKIVDAMCLKAIARGESVIKQGDIGDFFYIVKSGDFDILVQRSDGPPKKVFQAGVGFAFGELALLYNAPRSATIVARIESEVWGLDRVAFRNLVVRSAEAQFRARLEFLKGVDIFQVLDADELAALAEVLGEEEFEDDEAVLEQGEHDDKMFILQTGQAVACIRGEQGEVEVMHYSSGDYFGEIALLSGEPRKASVYAVGPCTCLYVSKPTFLCILGPLTSLLERNISKYERYQDAIANAADECEPFLDRNGSEGESLVAPDMGSEAKKAGHRKRERKASLEICPSPSRKVTKETSSQNPPETLVDKVAQDFQNPALVSPSPAFEVAESQMTMFGGLVSGQQFTEDKLVHVRSGAQHTKKGEEDTYEWQGPTKLKEATEISIVCQKGCKSAFDPTPNQDNFLVHHVGGVTVYCVADGHGPFGHLVSFRLVQALPRFLATSVHFGSDWEAALKEAFLNAQAELSTFCKSQGVNIEASGAACSVVVLEEQTVHVAFVGDARVMLGSWNRRDTRMIFATTDHKPELEGERVRLIAAGSEVREIEPGNFRIYLPKSNFPGLTMSRAFGDTACGGVVQEPEYHKFLMQPTDQWYCILASDGIWEFMQAEEVCKMTAKKLRLKGASETLQSLVTASRKRWAHCCGSYCDDITALLVQWNAPEVKDSTKNHALHVRQPELTR